MLHRLHGSGCKHTALLLLRLGLGIVFIIHGYDKVFSADGVTGLTTAVENMGLPAAHFLAWCAALIEFVGGIAMVLGLATPIFGVLIAVVMAVAFVGAKGGTLPEGDLAFILLIVSLALVLMGPGKYSLDALICKKQCMKNEKDSGKCDMKGGCCK